METESKMEPKTKTFAEIYESQGHYDKALNIYIEMLKENPLSEELTEDIKRVQTLIKKASDMKKRIIENQTAALEAFLKKAHAYKNI